MYTEGEAKNKICCVPEISCSGFCIASNCMAWRWGNSYENNIKSRRTREDGVVEIEYWSSATPQHVGYCGRAGGDS